MVTMMSRIVSVGLPASVCVRTSSRRVSRTRFAPWMRRAERSCWWV